MTHAHSLQRALSLSASVSALALLGACANGYGSYGGQGPYEGTVLSNREAQRQGYQQNLEDRVRAALRADPRVGASGLTVTSNGDSLITISGTPANGPAGRDLALMIARSVPGVRGVANNMTMN